VTRWTRDPGRPWRESMGSVLVLNSDREVVLLEAATAALWHSLSEAISEDRLTAELATLLGGSEEAIGEDVRRLLRDLEALALVLRSP